MRLRELARWHESSTRFQLASMVRLLLAVALAFAATACHTSGAPKLTVLGVHEAPRHEVVFVQVTNPASRPMRLTKLEYTFASAGETVSEGEVPLAREIPAGAAVVVEIPLDSPSEKPMTMSGKLTTELNDLVQIFSVSAQIAPSAAPAN
jgi:late embryogenesis abundant protein